MGETRGCRKCCIDCNHTRLNLRVGEITHIPERRYQFKFPGCHRQILLWVSILLLLGYPIWVPGQVAPSITNQPAAITVVAGSAAAFSVGVTGDGPFTYQWFLNGTNPLNDVITTIAGISTGTNHVFSGDGGPATMAALSLPSGVALDRLGDLYIADQGNLRIRKIDLNGIITTIAGNGLIGYSGDDVAATEASLKVPAGVAVDLLGNVYIADTGNSRVRKVDVNGIITTVAGTYTNGFSGDGGAATDARLGSPFALAIAGNGNLYITDDYYNRVRQVDTNGIITTFAGSGTNNGYSGDGGAATNASLSHPRGLAVDLAGDLFIGDSNYRVREVDTNGIITTVAGNGTNGYSGDGGAASNATISVAMGLAVDGKGNLFVADNGNQVVREVDSNGIIATIAGSGTPGFSGDGGPATNATLSDPEGLAVNEDGDLILADWQNNRIRKVFSPGGPTLARHHVGALDAGEYSVVVSSPYGSATGVVAALTVQLPPDIIAQPQSETVTNGDPTSFGVGVFGDAQFFFQWQKSGTNLTDNANISGSTTSNLVLNAAGTNDSGNYSVIITNSYGSVTSHIAVLTVGLPPSIAAQSTNVVVINHGVATFNVTATGTGPLFYQWFMNGSQSLNNSLTRVAGRLIPNLPGFAGDGGPAYLATLNNPTFLACDGWGNLFIVDEGNARVRRVDTNGIITTVAGGGFALDGFPAVGAQLSMPEGVAVDSNGNLFIADFNDLRIRKVDGRGYISTVAGNGVFGFSGDGGLATNANIGFSDGLTVDNSGNLLFAANNRIRRVDTNGIITTVAGLGAYGYSGDGGPATNASFNEAFDVKVDGIGDLVISDFENNRIRMVDSNGVITTIAGNGSAGYSGDGYAATNASLYWPSGIALDLSGNLFIADSKNKAVRKINTAGNITTIATNINIGTMANYFAVATDPWGDLYFSNPGFNQVYKLSPPGAATLTLGNATTNSVGGYSVIVSNAYGSITSSVANLTVVFTPSIVAQPQSEVAVNGKPASMSLLATGTPPLFYGWLHNGTNLTDDLNVSGSASSNATWNAVSPSDGGNYQVIITNAYGCVTSSVAVLNVAFPPSIVSSPSNQTALISNSICLSVSALGTGPFNYQWFLNGTSRINTVLITTVAGNGTNGFSGDGGFATNAALAGPVNVAVDGLGELFIADGTNCRVRKVDTNGIISTIAGNGTNRYSGDGGLATNASLGQLLGLAEDAVGNLFIADSLAERVRKIDTNGIITTVAGNGTRSFSGDWGQATNANLSIPASVALDNFGNLYIGDTSNARVRKVDTNGIITTLAGNGGTGFSGDGGAATNANLGNPSALALSTDGRLFICAQTNDRVRRVDAKGIITTVAGTGFFSYTGDGGQATNAGLGPPQGLASDPVGNLFISSSALVRVRKVDTNGIITTITGNGKGGYSGDGGAATNASVANPQGLAVDGNGNLFIADTGNRRVRKVTALGMPTLFLNQLGATNAGDYSVVVSSPYGSATSSVARVTVILSTNPVVNLQAAALSGGDFSLSWNALSAIPPISYQVQYRSNLTSGDWVNLGGVVSGTNISLSVTDAISNDPQRFYRVLPVQ